MKSAADIFDDIQVSDGALSAEVVTAAETDVDVKDSVVMSTLRDMGILEPYLDCIKKMSSSSDARELANAKRRMESLKKVIDANKAVAEIATKYTPPEDKDDTFGEIKITLLREIREEDVRLDTQP